MSRYSDNVQLRRGDRWDHYDVTVADGYSGGGLLRLCVAQGASCPGRQQLKGSIIREKE
jgi:hypothetical protein